MNKYYVFHIEPCSIELNDFNNPVLFYTVDTSKHMVGSYGPKSEPHVFSTKPDEAPSGMMGRGGYTVKSKFTDDDKNVYLEWEWGLEIKKEWPAA